MEHQFGTTASLRAQYVGTRAVNQPYLTQVNGYQTVCQGCFAPFPYGQPTDPRFGAVTQFYTGANSHYNGLQLTADEAAGARPAGTGQLHLEPLHGHGLERRIPAILRRRNSVAAAGRLGRDYGPCDYDIRHNLTAQYVYQLPIKVRNHAAWRTR